MTPRQKELVRNSLEKMKPIADTTNALFYGRLFNLDPSLEQLLQNNLEDRDLLMQMIGSAMNGFDRFSQLEPTLKELGARYAGYGVEECDYETMGTALLWTLERVQGESFTPDLKNAWTSFYELLADKMKAGAREAFIVRTNHERHITTGAGSRDHLSTPVSQNLKWREPDMRTLDSYEQLTARFATTLATLIFVLFLGVAAGAAKTITVTGTGDTIAVDGVVTLREAITAANTNAASGDASAGHPGLDVIKFNIPGGGVQTISPTSALPTITEQLTIDGYTQPGASVNALVVGDNAVLQIELNGTNAGVNTTGLSINVANCIIRGLAINRFGLDGVDLLADNTQILGNYIGVDPTGLIDLGNFRQGVMVKSSNNVFGTSAPADRNVISGNGPSPQGSTGIFLFGNNVSGNKIQGNYIGTNSAGTSAIPNTTNGINIAAGDLNIVGGSKPGEGNLISGNGGAISIGNFSTNTKIIGNLIGTKADGISPLGNDSGIGLGSQATSAVIGGTAPGEGNVIAFSQGGAGITVLPQNQKNAILGNSIFHNQSANQSRLGIDLFDNSFIGGVTPNDPGDIDTGGNGLQNFPVITSATANGNTTNLQGTLNSTANAQFRIELFSNSVCSPSGFGEGEKYIGFTTVNTDVNGNGNFTLSVSNASLVGQIFTATATDANGNTSEFSACASGVVSSPGTLQLSTNLVSQQENSGSFTLNVNRTNGSTGTVTVHYATADNTANAPSDYTSTSGTLTFNDGEMSKTITVPIIDDNIPEGTETFTLTLSNPTGGAVLGNLTTATFFIQDNDKPTLSINDVSQVEGNSGTTAFTFTVTSSNALPYDVDATYATANGTATAGSDYQPTNGVISIKAGQTTKTITVNVSGDTSQEPDETFFVNLSLANNATIAKAQGTGTIINDDAPAAPTLQFNNATYTVQEDLGALTITVTRSGDSSGTASVNYTTNDGTATQKGDFEYAAGKLTFAPGDTSKTIQVLINEDMYLEGQETFGLTLSNATGASLGAQSTASVAITDDSPESITNPIDDAQSFVYTLYHDFLNREPDPSGLAFWTSQINSCGANQVCIDLKRANVSAAFFLSIEFQQTGYLVERIYKASYGNLPGAPVPLRLNEFVPDTRAIGQGLIVGQAGWQQVIENNTQAFAAEFVQRSRFTLAYPVAMTPAQFVDALSTNAGLVPLPADRQAAINEFGGGGTSADIAARARALRDVAENPKLAQQEFNSAFVLMQYFGYLRRDPNASPEPGLNYAGYNFWLGKLNQFNGNYNDAEMVKAFLISSEYRQRFGPF